MEYQKFQQSLGELAHRQATEEYKQKRQRQNLFFHNRLRLSSGKEIPIGSWGLGADISRAITRADVEDPYLALLLVTLQTQKMPAFNLEPSDPGRSRQPDLASVDLHELYEIKPNTIRPNAKLESYNWRYFSTSCNKEIVNTWLWRRAIRARSSRF